MLGLLRRLWLPLVVLAVAAAGGLTVARIHGIVGSETSPTYNESGNSGGTVAVASSQVMRYEIFGPPGTVAEISYFNGDGDVEFARGVNLPWSLDFTITTAASIGSVAAQGNSDSIGCRITVDGVVKAEKITEQVSAFTSCMLKAA
ncbi:MAG: MmpS family transport accessory protein [Mycobacterium sp.]